MLDSLFQEAGKHTQARAFEEALEIMAGAEVLARQAFGEESAEYGKWNFHNGLVYHAKGDYPQAEKWLLRSKSILEEAPGKENIDYATVLHYLGVVYYHMGNNYEKSEFFYLEAKAIKERTIGKEQIDYTTTLTGLGDIYYFTGNVELAENYYREALKIREKILGKEDILYGECLRKMGNVSAAKGQYEEAARYYRENIAITEKRIGKENATYAVAIMNLGGVYLGIKKYPEAELYFLEVKRILEGISDYTEHPHYMTCNAALGILYYETGQFELSENYHLIAKDLRGRMLGKEHLSYEMSLAFLSDLYWKMGKYPNAAQCFSEASSMRRTFLSDATRHFSEKEVFSYVEQFEKELDKHFSYAWDFSGETPAFSGNCYDNILFHKGFLLESSYRFRKADAHYPGFDAKFAPYHALQKQIAAEYARSPEERNGVHIAKLESQANALEKDLARTVAGFSEAIRQVNWQEVQAGLAPHEAALEYVHFKYHTPDPTDSVLYAALLLRPGMETPRFIPLFEEKSLEALLPALEKNRSEYVSKLYQNEAATRLVWSPAEEHLQGVRTVYCAPSGLLHRLNLAALPLPGAVEGAILADRYDIVLVGSTRQLAHRTSLVHSDGTDGGSTSADAAVFGAVRYDMDSTVIQPIDTDNPNTVDHRGLSFAENDAALRGGEWVHLKHSGRETANVAAILQKAGMQVEMRQGFSATEEAFKRLGEFDPELSPRIVHFSTHGYFFPDPVSVGSRQSAVGQPVFKLAEHPMIRSGLILAGANYAWINGKPLGKREDGVLTAYEISQLDLRNTELVVLSACETGLGDIRGNEGVYGLQRAFKIAGAKNLIMSLWQVPDYQTQELMTVFYQKWLMEKLPLRQALQAAQKAMQDKGYEPYYWAGWVLVE